MFAIAAPWPRKRFESGSGAALAWLWAEEERSRRALWLAPVLMAGVLAYFGLPKEPPAWLGALFLILFGGAWLMARILWARTALLLCAAVLSAGFAAAQLRSFSTGTPILDRRIGPVIVEGRVAEIAPLPERGGRVLLQDLSIGRLAPEETPARVRIRIDAELGQLGPGDRVRVLAALLPPPPPAAPGAFDYQRQAWFEGIGAVGHSYGGLRAHLPAEAQGGWGSWWAALRHAATGRILAGMPGAEGAVAAALMTGHQGAIPQETIDAMRDSGLAHLLSISGLHIGLVAGLVFFVMRAGLALWPWLALRVPTKKWAAVVAVLGAGAYVLMAGATVPTQRAFLMTVIVMLAILVDRTALTMRMVAWAAALILLVRPEALLGASFQMSFAAVTGLIAANEAWSARPRVPAGPLARAGRFLASVAVTSLVAGIATAPFAAFHFNRLSDYGVLANMAAVPITGLWVMPLAVLAFALMPLSLEAWALEPMRWGIAAILWVAHAVAALPGAAVRVPALPASALLAFAFGAVWLCLWRSRRRWLGLAGLPAAALLIAMERPPDLLIAGDAGLVAIRDSEGSLRFAQPRAGGIVAETWLERNGQGARLGWPEASAGGGCDGQGCRAIVQGRSIALARSLGAAAEDCGTADLVVVLRFLRASRCRGSVLIDRASLWREGAHALWIEEDGLRIETVRDGRGNRPWVADRNRPESRLGAWRRWPR